MRPGMMASPSSACAAGSRPARDSTVGSMLLTPGARCQTTNTAAGRSAGRPATSRSSAPMPPAEAPITTMSFVAIPCAMQASRPERSGCDLFHQQDDAFALLVGQHERRAGDAALDFPAAPVDGIEQRFLVLGLAREAGPQHAAQLRHRQADVESEQSPALDLVGAQAPEILGAPVPHEHVEVVV